MNWRDHIDRNPEVLAGKPKIKSTRIGVGLILGRLGDGWSADHLIEAYPGITTEQIQACRTYAAEAVGADEGGVHP